MQNQKGPVLKKPVGVYFLAFLFLLAPLGNILISFAGSKVDNWHDASVFTVYLQSIPFVDWVWLGLLFITGLLLFRPHKLSWSIAIGTLLIVLFINAYRLFNVDLNSIDPGFLKVFSLLAILTTLAVLVIAFYFRFPYLDRRANWFKNIERFDYRTEAIVNDIKGVTESLSLTGCRISFSKAETQLVKGNTVTVQLPEVSQHVIQAEIIEKLEFGLRIEFLTKEDSRFRNDLKNWIKIQG